MVDQFLAHLEKNITITIKHEINLPIGAGFGCSGAGALSASLALNEELGFNFSNLKCGQIAHVAEVKNKTGLGDVIGSFFGGFEIRVKPGAPGVGEIRKIELSPDLSVVCAAGGVLETKKVLNDEILRKKIIDAGNEYLKQIINDESIEISEIIQKARDFSFKTGLMTPEIKKALNSLNQSGFGNSSMIMLGQSMFCLTEKNKVKEVVKILRKNLISWSIFNSLIDNDGARLLKKGD